MHRIVLVLGLTLLVSVGGLAQEILFDELEAAGGLQCFPSKADATRWYYLPDKPHLVVDDEGRPQFSFLMYVTPGATEEGEGITRAPGGGIVHFLVAYDVSEEQVRRANSELRRLRPGAELVGPVAYVDGSFALVTAVEDPQAGLSRRVVGTGRAPVMAGHKAAVSMHLTPAGASLLWESFHQETPDISVAFEMQVSGYLNPVEARMAIDYEKAHRTIQAQAAGRVSFFAGELDVLMKKMRDNGAITVELTGAPPSAWNEIQKLGLELARNQLFESQGGRGLAALAAMQQKSSPMDHLWERFGNEWKSKSGRLGPLGSRGWPEIGGHPGLVHTLLLGSAGGRTAREGWTAYGELEPNEGVEEETASETGKSALREGWRLYLSKDYEGASAFFREAYRLTKRADILCWIGRAFYKAGSYEQAIQYFDRYVEQKPALKGDPQVAAAREAIQVANVVPFAEPSQEEQLQLARDYFRAIPQPPLTSDDLPAESISKSTDTSQTDQRESATSRSSDRTSSKRLKESSGTTGQAESAQTGEATGTNPVSQHVGKVVDGTPEKTPVPSPQAEKPKQPKETGDEKEGTSSSTAATPSPKASKPGEKVKETGKTDAKAEAEKRDTKKKASTSTPYGVIASFKLRRIQRTGSFSFNLKQWNRIDRTVRFAENIGDLTSWLNDPSVFRRVNLDDPVFKQREIPVTVDVAGEAAFGAMLNAVTVQLKKRHASGRETVDEVTVRRDNLSDVPLKLVYGWDQDNDRERWLKYQTRVRWHYVGGPEIETGWLTTSAGAQVLRPPLRPREVFLEADPEYLEARDVRDVVIEVRYDAGGVERAVHATVRPRGDVGETRLVLYQDPQQPEYTYSFTWRLRGGRRISVGPFTDTADFIYLDEVPQG